MSINLSTLCKNFVTFRTRPKFLVIGAQKCGTSALHYYLSQHPSLVPARDKEIDFFSCNAKYAKGSKSYLKNFPACGFRRQLGYEVSPSYLHNPLAAQRIYDYNSKLKLVAILRNPIERAFSAWRMYFRYFSTDRGWYIKWMENCNGSSWSKAKLLRRQPDVIHNFDAYVNQELCIETSNESIEAPILSHGLYYAQLDRFASLFGESNLLVLLSSDLSEQPITVLSRIEAFLEIPPNDWSHADLSPVFVGKGPMVEISEDTWKVLSAYYREDSNFLFRKYGISFETEQWPKAQ